jgi:hypothetical protein
MPLQTAKPPLTTEGSFPADRGPAEWLIPFLEARVTSVTVKPKLSPAEMENWEAQILAKEDAAIQELIRQRRGEQAAPTPPGEVKSVLQPGRGKEVLSEVHRTYWYDLDEAVSGASVARPQTERCQTEELRQFRHGRAHRSRDPGC